MRIVALFTILFIAHGRCKPSDYHNDAGDDFDYGGEGTDDNIVDDVTSEATSPAQLVTRPQKRIVRLGEDVRLPCNVTNSDTVLISWFRDQEPLYVEQRPFTSEPTRIVRENDNTLVIRQFRNTDVSDNYRCEVASEPPQQVKHSVRVSKQIFVYPEHVVIDKSNQNVRLSCQANWEPRPTFKWYHKGVRVNSDAVPKDGSSLTVYNATINDAGFYQCLAETVGEKEPLSNMINFIVHHAPQVKVQYKRVHTGVGMETEFKCLVDAFPEADVTWYKDGVEISAANDKVVRYPNKVESNHTYVLTNTQVSNFGLYKCRAHNYLGSAEGLISLTGAPSEPKFEGLVSDDKETPIAVWEVESFFPITKYTFKYRPVGKTEWHTDYPAVSDDGTDNTFKVKCPLENLQAGDYDAMLIALNNYGSSVSKIYKIKGGTNSAESVTVWRSLILAASLLAYTTHL